MKTALKWHNDEFLVVGLPTNRGEDKLPCRLEDRDFTINRAVWRQRPTELFLFWSFDTLLDFHHSILVQSENLSISRYIMSKDHEGRKYEMLNTGRMSVLIHMEYLLLRCYWRYCEVNGLPKGDACLWRGEEVALSPC